MKAANKYLFTRSGQDTSKRVCAERKDLTMSEQVLTNGLHYAVYEKLLDGATLIAVFRDAQAAEEYKVKLQSKNKNKQFYTKEI